MSVLIFNTIDLFVFSGIILAAIIAHTFASNEVLPLSSEYRTKLALSIMAVMAIDLVARLDLKLAPETLRAAKYALNSAYFLLQPLPVSLGLMYLFSLFREKRFTYGERALFLLPFFAGAALVAANCFTGLVFTIDGNNAYRRGPGVFLYAAINYSYIVPAFALVMRHRDIIKRRTLLTVLAYTIIPCAGSLAQLICYGIVTTWPTYALAILIAYIFLESRRSDRDYLTGVLNRQSFDTRVYKRMARAKHLGPFALVIVDIDRFKTINDAFGHDKGDEILQVASGILSHSIAGTDTLARYGGDEFIMLIETSDEQVVHGIIRRFDANIEEWSRRDPAGFALSLSAGFALYNPLKHASYKELFKEADAALFSRKAERRDQTFRLTRT